MVNKWIITYVLSDGVARSDVATDEAEARKAVANLRANGFRAWISNKPKGC